MKPNIELRPGYSWAPTQTPCEDWFGWDIVGDDTGYRWRASGISGDIEVFPVTGDRVPEWVMTAFSYALEQEDRWLKD